MFRSLTALALASLAIVAVHVPSAHALVGNGKITFSSDRDAVIGNPFEIYLMNADGSNQTRLTNAPGFDVETAWSPDGKKIVFRSSRDGENQLYIMNPDGTGQTRLTNNARSDIHPAFSPDGSRIVFASFHDNRYDCYVIDADGTDEIQLTSNGDGQSCQHPSFSPDGSKIVFGFEDPSVPVFDIYVMNADGTGATNLTAGAGFDFWPSWSPDGTRILFQRFNFTIGRNEIFVMDADNGGNLTNLTNNSDDNNHPAWSPDGTKIVWTANCCGDDEIFVMNADGTNPTALTNNAARDWFPAWGPLIDSDGDGIFDDVDVEPTTPSTRFSDVPLGGQTVGDIVSVPARTRVAIVDDPAVVNGRVSGVKVTTSVEGSPAPPPSARVTLQLVGKKNQEKVAIPAVATVTDPETETTVEVTEDGPAEIVVVFNGRQLVVTIHEGSSATLVETTNSSNVLTDVTITDVTGEPGGVTLNGVPVTPGQTLAVGGLTATLSVVKSQFTLSATFTPSPSSNGVHPLSEDVTLVIGSYTFHVPAGSFRTASDGAYAFNGTVAGVKISMAIKPVKGGKWSVKANGKPVTGITSSSPVSLRIGDDAA